ncbi:MAG: CD225/dispanin family protein [Bacteroidaceae bacterium]|nr:CD225/dispanin family protein [Bacteroidaceae bacterium]
MKDQKPTTEIAVEAVTEQVTTEQTTATAVEQEDVAEVTTIQKAVKKPKSHMTLAILSTLLFLHFPLGIVSIFHAFRVKRLWNKGESGKAAEASAKAKKWAIISIILGIIIDVIIILFLGAILAGIVFLIVNVILPFLAFLVSLLPVIAPIIALLTTFFTSIASLVNTLMPLIGIIDKLIPESNPEEAFIMLMSFF